VSFDLAVWHEAKNISAAEAQTKYENAPGGETKPSDEVVGKFVELLTARHPGRKRCQRCQEPFTAGRVAPGGCSPGRKSGENRDTILVIDEMAVV